MTRAIDDDRLNAFIDGELTPEESAAMAKALHDDEAARAMTDDLRGASALIKAAVSEPVAGTPADRLTQAVEEAWAARPTPNGRIVPPRRSADRTWQLTAIAASLAGIVVGLTGGYLAGTAGVEQQIARLEAAQNADRAVIAELASAAVRQQDDDAIDQLVSFALEKNKSGEAATWQDASGVEAASITPTRTFRAADGKWCREYTRTSKLGGGVTLRGIACRESDGHWRTRLQVLGDG